MIAFLWLTLAQFSLAQSNQISVHDPVIIKQDDTYYIFATGPGIAVWSSKDMQHWNRGKKRFCSGSKMG
ncbi:family 43 glycosylhydrolase [Pontibacter chitinilyticus]|uniref:family 43 glycosylhydrolase n=1 Tax=Pontibacter chitinilyticus TaxID=2674989 RepID=UPI00321B5A0D